MPIMTHWLYIGNHSNLATVVAQTFTENTVAAVFENRGFNRTIHQDIAGCLPCSMVTLIDLSATEIEPVAARKRRMLSGECDQMGHKVCYGGCTGATGNANHWNTTIVMA